MSLFSFRKPMLRLLIYACTVGAITGIKHNLFAQTPSTETSQETKPDTTKEKMELPDVIIYGTERSSRMAGKKLQPGMESTSLFKRSIEYNPASTEKPSESDKATLAEYTENANAMTLLSLGYGQYNTPTVHAVRWQQLERFNYGIDGQFINSDGEYDFSQFQRINGRGHIGMQLLPNLLTEVRGYLQNNTYGLYGFVSPTLVERESSTQGVSLSTQSTIRSNQQLIATADVNQFRISDTDADSESKEQTAGFSLSYQAPLPKRMQLSLSAVLDNISNELSDSSVQAMRYQGALLIPISHNISICPSVAYDYISDYKNRVSPGIECVYTPSNSFGISLIANQQLQLKSLHQLAQENPYTSRKLQPRASDMVLNIESAIEFKLTPLITTGVNISKQWIEDYTYWQIDKFGYFSTIPLEKINLTTIAFSSKFQITQSSQISIGFHYIIDEITDYPVPGTDVHIPYVEDFRLPVECTLQLPYQINLQASATWIGKRYIDIAATQELGDYLDISLNAEKKLSNHLSLFAQIDNVANSTYDVWQNYPAFGVFPIVGLTGKW